MAFFHRFSSVPSLLDDDTKLPDSSSRVTGDRSDEDSIASESSYGRPPCASSPPEARSIQSYTPPEAGSIQSYSESEQSPVLLRRTLKKKRPAPPPPRTAKSCSFPDRCNDVFEHIGRLSADSELLRVEPPNLSYQTSTDSENAATEEQSEGDETSRSGHPSPQISPKDRSRLWTLRNALRSPRNIRKAPRVEAKSDADKVTFVFWRNTVIEPPEFSVCTLTCVPEDLWDLDTEFEVKRIPEYDRHLSELLQATDEAHPDYEQLCKAVKNVQDMVKDGEDDVGDADNEHKMEAVQDRFPHDDLQLQKADKTQKPRSLSARRRSAPSAVVFKTLSGNRPRSSSGIWSQSNMGRKDGGDMFQSIRQTTDINRQYIMEGPAVFARGVQTQERYLFLFNDLLLVAKQKSSSTFKLKFRVRLCDVWIATCVEDVCEITRPVEKSFVLGWPTCNVVATFKDSETKEKWESTLSQNVREQKIRTEPKEIQLKISVRDTDKTGTICRVTVTNSTQAKEVLQACIQQLNIPETEAKDYKLWVWSAKEASPYPLIGHETPFSIKLNHVRQLARSRGEDIDKMTQADLTSALDDDQPQNAKCDFILSQKKSPKKHSLDETSHKALKKAKRDKLFNIFKRTAREDKTNNNNIPAPLGKLFGRPLNSVIESNSLPPKPIVDLLTVLFREGPETVGILRKSPNVKLCREIKEKLDQGESVGSCEGQAPVAGYVIKEFLRDLPDSLLRGELFEDWLKVGTIEDMGPKIAHVRNLLAQLPSCNIQLLKRLLCALHRIQRHSAVNKMTSSNLSLCIAPSLLWHKKKDDPSLSAPAVTFLIDHCVELFGEEVLHILGEPQELRGPPDSGTDSESMHSVLSMHDGSNGVPRDDSSMDSLDERDLYVEAGESSPKLAKSHLSPTNLSRDSGLTLSDTQLYDDGLEAGDPRGKFSARSASNFADSQEYERHARTLDPARALEDRFNPVPPPRRRFKRQEEGGVESEHAGRIDAGGGGGSVRGRDKRHTLHVSTSSSHLYEHFHTASQLSSSLRADPYGTMPSNVADDTSYAMDDVNDRVEYERFLRSHSGLLRKSPSGAHLFLDNELLPRGGAPRDELRQSSCVDNTPPQSPESKMSQSSRDSVISDSSYSMDPGMSRENSIASAPVTPDVECGEGQPPWFPKLDSNVVKSCEAPSQQPLAKSFSLPPGPSLTPDVVSVSSSSTSQPRSVQNVAYLVSPPASPVRELEFQDSASNNQNKENAYLHPSASSWMGKADKAEDVAFTPLQSKSIGSCSSRSEEQLDVAVSGKEHDVPYPSYGFFPLELHHRPDVPLKYVAPYSRSFAKESPPPRVILQSLHSPRLGKDPAPVRASHDKSILDQLNKSSGGNQGRSAGRGLAFDVAKSMDSIRPDEYITVQPKLTFIRRDEAVSPTHSSSSDSSSSSKESVTSGKDTQSSWKDSLSSGSDNLAAENDAHTNDRQTITSSVSTLTSSESKRPTKPPCYSAALQRKFMIKHALTPDVTLSQKEASERAKLMYEESLQRYLQERYEVKHYGGSRGQERDQRATTGADPGDSPQPPLQQTINSTSATNSSGAVPYGDEDEYVTLKMTEHKFSSSFGDTKQFSLDGERFRQSRDRAPSPRWRVGHDLSQRSAGQLSASAETAIRPKSSSVPEREPPRKDLLHLPASSLHRSFSDSSNQMNKHDQNRPRSQSRDRAIDNVKNSAVSDKDNSRALFLMYSMQTTQRSEERSEVSRRNFPTVFSALSSEHNSRGRLPTKYPLGDSLGSRAPAHQPPCSNAESKTFPMGDNSSKSSRTDLSTHRSAFTAVSLASAAAGRSVDDDRRAVDRVSEAMDRVSEASGSVVDLPSSGPSNRMDRSKGGNRAATDLTVTGSRSASERTSNASRFAVDNAGEASYPNSFNSASRVVVDSATKSIKTGVDSGSRPIANVDNVSKPITSILDSGSQSKSVKAVGADSCNAAQSEVDNSKTPKRSVDDGSSTAVRSTVKPKGDGGAPAEGCPSGSAAALPCGTKPLSSGKPKDLPWSVESLRKIYDADSKPRQSSPEVLPTAAAVPRPQPLHTSSGPAARPAPPPYQDPPPFHRHNDSSRLSMSSSASSSSGSTGRNTPPASGVTKFGPQCAAVEFGSCEDVRSGIRCTSRDRSASGGRSDLRKRASYTDVSYV